MAGGIELARALLVAALSSALAACGSDEAVPSAGGAGGVGASGGGGTAGADAAAGAGGAGGDGGPQGCVDIRVSGKALASPPDWWTTGTTIGTAVDRDHFWRDAAGIHMAWNALYAEGGGAMVVSSYDAETGKTLGHRFFLGLGGGDGPGFWAGSSAPDGTVGLGIATYPGDPKTPVPALLLIRTDDASYEKLYPLPPWPDANTILVGVSWDGEAFAVHGFGAQNVQYVTRITTDGTVLLPPTPFGKTFGYPDEVRYVTDADSGVSYAASGRNADMPWVTGHLRDGTSTPNPGKIEGMQVDVQGVAADAGWGGGVTHPAITAYPGGAAVLWSTGGGSVATVTTFIQAIDKTLAPSADAIGIPAEQYAPPSKDYDGNDWLTGQKLPGAGWWLAGTNKLVINEFIVDSAGKSTRRALVTHGGAVLATSQFESFKYGDELWLGFVDASSSKEQPFRILRVKPECTYQSMFDLIGG